MKKDIALVIVDMQDFFLKNFADTVRGELISNQEIVVDFCVNNDIPAIIMEYKAGGKVRGETTHKLKTKVKDITRVVIVKESNSGFTKTSLHTVLQNLEVKKLLLIGLNANGCIQDTAIGAIRRGYKVITAQGVIASSSRGDLSLSRRNKKWFENNTTFFANKNDLLNYLK